MQATRDNAFFLRKAKKAHYLWPILGNQPNLNAQLNACLGNDPHHRRDQRDQPRPHRDPHHPRPAAPDGTGFQDAARAVLIERYTTSKKKGQWRTRCEAVLYITSLAAEDAPRKTCWPTSAATGGWSTRTGYVLWKEDKSLIRTGNAPQIWSALANLVITLFRIHGVTSYTAETRRCAQDPRTLQFLDLTGLSPG